MPISRNGYKAVDAFNTEEDARSLAIQAQIAAEARKVAWQQTYGNSRSVPGEAKPARAESPGNWQSFTPIRLDSIEQIQGVYAIVQITTGRLYVGSSNDVIDRVKKHFTDLRAEHHHAVKLQRAWLTARGEGFRFLLIERVPGPVRALRGREQYWIAELRAYPEGFNSKSTADGPQPSLHTLIDAAIKDRWQALYEPLAPRRPVYQPNASDLSVYNEEMKAYNKAVQLGYIKKLKYAVIAFVLALLASEQNGLGLLWLGVAVCILFIFSDDRESPPDSPQKRADARAAADYHTAIAEAGRRADALLIGQLAPELGVPEERVAAAYAEASGVVQKRNELRQKFRASPRLRFRAERNRWRARRG